jgi:hypothetical protein
MPPTAAETAGAAAEQIAPLRLPPPSASPPRPLPPPVPRSRYRGDDSDDDWDDDEDFEDERPRRRRRRSADYIRESSERESGPGFVCALMSVTGGSIGIVLCPMVICLASLVLGIIGIVLCRNKTLAIIGTAISGVGLLIGVGIILLFVAHPR